MKFKETKIYWLKFKKKKKQWKYIEQCLSSIGLVKGKTLYLYIFITLVWLKQWKDCNIFNNLVKKNNDIQWQIIED